MAEVFRALSDPTRRSLLDALSAEDGQTLSTLERRLPMTRFCVMKRLRVLEEAHLVTTTKRGREKLPFLNRSRSGPRKLTVVHDELREGANDELYGAWTMILSGLKTLLETGDELTTPASLRFAGAAGG